MRSRPESREGTVAHGLGNARAGSSGCGASMAVPSFTYWMLASQKVKPVAGLPMAPAERKKSPRSAVSFAGRGMGRKYWVHPVVRRTLLSARWRGLSVWSAPSPMMSGASRVDFAQKVTASYPERLRGKARDQGASGEGVQGVARRRERPP